MLPCQKIFDTLKTRDLGYCSKIENLRRIASLRDTAADKVVGINCLNLALFGGMVHCVTQQQPALDGIVSAD